MFIIKSYLLNLIYLSNKAYTRLAEMEEETIERITMAISNVFSIVLILMMSSDVLGIPLTDLMYKIITTPWVIPYDIIVQYWYVWEFMRWTLLIAMIADNMFTWRYYSKHKEYPPPSYVLYLSATIFFTSFFLFAIFRTTTFAVLTFFGSLAMLNAVMQLKG